MADIEDVVRWVVYQSREKGHPVTEALGAYIAHSTVNPETGRFFLEDGLKSDAEAKQLVELAVAKLSQEGDPALETLRMQIAYDSAYIQQETFHQHFQSVQSQETNSYIDEIVNCETRSGNDFEGITLLYKKIFAFLLFRNKQVGLNFANSIIRPGGGVGSLNALANVVLNPPIPPSTLNTIEREVAAALESVLPRPGLRPFVAMSTAEKVSQLMELSNIVIGIRLYNKETGKGGAGLDSFEHLVSHPSRDLLNILNKEVVNTVEQCEDYTAALKALSDSDTDQLETWKTQLTHRRQYLSYLLALQEDVQAAEGVIEGLHSRYIRELIELKELIGNKTSIPKDQVYPKFDTLCQVYTQMNEEKNKSILRRELFRILSDHKNKVPLSMSSHLLQESRPGTPELAEDPEISNTAVSRLTSENTAEFMHLPLDYQGFCIWSLVEKNGLLVPGKPSYGVIRFADRHFVLASPQALQEFAERPEYYLKECMELARKKPELIHLLRLSEEFPTCSLTHLLQGKDGSPFFSVTAPLMLDQECETPLHFVDSYIDTSYHWNEWELRRKALQMADIRKKQTSSVQTVLSNFRRENETQVYLPKEQSSQTGINNWTDMDWTINRMYASSGEATDETHGLENKLNYVVGVRAAEKWTKTN